MRFNLNSYLGLADESFDALLHCISTRRSVPTSAAAAQGRCLSGSPGSRVKHAATMQKCAGNARRASEGRQQGSHFSLMTHFPSHLDIMKATLSTNILALLCTFAAAGLVPLLPSSASCHVRKGCGCRGGVPTMAARDSKGREVVLCFCFLARGSPRNFLWKASFPRDPRT